MSDLSMLINGLKVTAEKGATFERRNPLDGTVATRAPACSPADAVMAVEAAAEAFKTWSETGPSERRALLLKAAEKLEAKTPQFVEAVAAETGATGMWAGFNVFLAAGMIREAAALTTTVAPVRRLSIAVQRWSAPSDASRSRPTCANGRPSTLRGRGTSRPCSEPGTTTPASASTQRGWSGSGSIPCSPATGASPPSRRRSPR